MDGKMRLNDAGRVAADSWQWLEQQYDYVGLDEWVVMPNHFHGIIVITDASRRGGSRTAPTTPSTPQPTGNHKPLGRLIGAFKTVSTKQINEMRNTSGGKLWQRNYYEHIIRNEKSLQRIREYIVNNPLQWESDQENPNAGAPPRLPRGLDRHKNRI